jgi:hypothetical protein
MSAFTVLFRFGIKYAFQFRICCIDDCIYQKEENPKTKTNRHAVVYIFVNLCCSFGL